ncbi:hypothetical protein KAX17_09300, partial [Candidatus Bipolaricaulota bacterium]|nr:hypothetical protein [Candidatus Bipolaricaulota bacterium]
TRLTQQYLRHSMRLYRDTRQEARHLLQELKERGYEKVRIEGEPKNDLVDVCRLTCLEEGVEEANTEEESAPVLLVDGRELSLDWPAGSEVASRKSRVEISGSKRHGADKTV